MMRLIVTLILICIPLISTYCQGVIQKRGYGWVQLSQYITRSDSYFDSDSERISIRTNALYMTTLSGEYGITDRLTAIIAFPFFARSTVNQLEYNQTGNIESGGSLNSLGDTDIGLRFGVLQNFPLQINGFVTFGLPFGKKGNVGTETDIQTGDGEFNQIAGIELRHNFSSIKLSTSGYVAFNNRTRDFSNEIRYGFETCYKAKRLFATASLSVIESLFNDTAPVSLNSIFSNHREWVAPGVEVGYRITEKVSFLAAGTFTVSGRNTTAAPAWIFGIRSGK